MPGSHNVALFVDSSAVCDYCETDEFLDYEAARAAEETLQQLQQVRMAAAMPEAKEGTLPPLFFAPSLAKPRMQRRPSFKSKSSPSKGRTEIGDVDKRDAQSKKAYPPSKPMHRCAQPSYLSGEAKAPNYRGLLNLGIIVLVVSNFRLLLDTIQTHGFVLTKNLAHSSELTRFFESRDAWQDFPVVSGFLLLGLFLMIAFGIEWLLSRKKIDEAVGMILHQINSLSALFVPLVFVWTAVESPTIGFVLIFHALITWMKLVSYAQANEDYRLSANKDSALFLVENLDLEEEELRYPQNITLRNMLYFWCAPTLTYQLAFPKYPVRRWWKIASLSFRLILAGSLVFFLTAQAVMPLLENLIGELESTGGAYTFPLIAKYWLKLSIASTYTWLLVFYLYFHLYLNLSAELLRFGDRVFYKDWWNSCEASSFWRLWNMPVHYWLIRHVYFPCIRLKMGRTGATLAVFFLSAILHELVISVPIHLIRPWSFLGMMAQLPLVGMTKFMYRKLPGSSIGNLMFWISFCVIGQPIAVLLYAIDYQFLKETGETVEIFQANCRFTWWGRCLLGG
jgi:diacylglycerol O-acyltransferase-1